MGKKQFEIGQLIRLGPWFGRVTDIFTSERTGEKFARVRLSKHLPGITEVHTMEDLSPATEEQANRARAAELRRHTEAWEAICP